MKDRVFSKRQIIFWGFVLILVSIGMALFKEREFFAGGAAIFIACAGLFVSFTLPLYFEFDKKQIRIQYWFGFYEVIPWKQVTEIYETTFSSRSIFLRQYTIRTRGASSGKKAFFTNGDINANGKTKKLIRKYWKTNFEK